MATLRAAGVVLLSSALLPAQSLIWPGEDIATIDAQHLRAYVPAASAEQLRELVARADTIYGRMQQDAGFVAHDKLRLLVADWQDDHNGYSFVVPFPLVQVELAPSMPESPIFAGGLDAERTLVHEFAHQISNDRNHGLRGGLETVFGRVLPNDILSLLLWYLSTPAHQTMPRFWQEGLAVWAETAYADPASAWAGRGRDPLTHMIWRLDAAANAIPDESEWRITWHEWPFGGNAYHYGTAYLRWLEGHLGGRAPVWKLVARQGEQWAFLFDRGPRGLTGERHAALLGKARRALLEEQQAVLAQLRAAPVTAATRRTPHDMLVAAPAWRGPELVFAAKPAQGRARLHTFDLREYSLPSVDAQRLHGSSTPMLAMSAVRALPDGGEHDGLCWHEFNWRGIGTAHVDGHVFGWRVLQPDAGPLRDGTRTVVLVRLRDGGGQDLVVHMLRDGNADEGSVLPTKNTPWSPALRPGADHDGELVWVETSAAGSTLVLGSLRDPALRHELWSVKGRMMHPAWTADGASLFCCADHTGVANAYRVTIDGKATVTPVTNTIGGVVACVPSPDGSSLAIVDHDEHGPFLATIAADPSTFAKQVPEITLAWPAPGGTAGTAPAPLPTPAANAAAALTVTPYSGLGELRPLFWAPSTFAVPTGGYGAYGLMADPLFTNVVYGGAGVGFAEAEPVAFVGFDHLGSVIQYGASAGRSELTFADTVIRGNDELDYTETVTHGEVRAGRGLFALERTFVGYVSAGVEDHDQVNENQRDNVGGTPLKAPFRDTDQYAEITIGYDDSTFYPTSYSSEDGVSCLATWRRSFGHELERNRALVDAGYVWSLFPTAGHQVVVRGQLGWSDGDDVLQGAFSVGGGLSTGLPRGYYEEAIATGRYLEAVSLAYRFPLWRPFTASSTTPFRGRQIVAEVFGDGAKVSDNELFGNDDWYTSVGAELHVNAEFFDAILSPGLGVAVQLDGERDVRAYFSLGFTF